MSGNRPSGCPQDGSPASALHQGRISGQIPAGHLRGKRLESFSSPNQLFLRNEKIDRPFVQIDPDPVPFKNEPDRAT